ncbi:hypothetical protein HK405_012292 [Cladochytrium tenue]|nr:hypothetical protein HK405_012292 [Cladochytrium tenue]
MAKSKPSKAAAKKCATAKATAAAADADNRRSNDDRDRDEERTGSRGGGGKHGRRSRQDDHGSDRRPASSGENEEDADRRLRQQLAKLGLRVREARLRAAACAHVERHAAEYAPFCVDEPLTAHVVRMRRDGVYGGNLELVALARVLHVDVAIHQLDSPVWVVSGADWRPGGGEVVPGSRSEADSDGASNGADGDGDGFSRHA